MTHLKQAMTVGINLHLILKSWAALRGCSAEHGPGDDHAHCFACALVYLRDLGVAHQTLYLGALAVAVSAMYLDGLYGMPHGCFRCIEFRHCRFLTEWQLLVFEPGRMIGKESGRGDVRSHIRYHPGNGLVAGYGGTELYPLLRIPDGFVEGRLEDADALSGDSYPAAVEAGHCHRETCAFL